nr:MAG TPA: hypothetical protein [Caudoviricetes sp.]
MNGLVKEAIQIFIMYVCGAESVPMTKMTSREQFEAWVKTTNSDLERYKTGIHKGDFKNPVMRKMWLAWQASRAAIEIEQMKALTTRDALAAGYTADYATGVEHGIQVMENAIELAGLKVKA